MRKLWILAVLLAVVFVGPPAWTAGRAVQAELYGEYMELYGPMCWGPDTSGCVEIDAPNSGTASNRTFFRGDMTWAGVGLADACHDVLDATVSTMSTSTWETLITCTVDIPGPTDRVLASVAGQFAWMGGAAFVIDFVNDALCEVSDPTAPDANVTCRALASTITDPAGITRRTAGGFWISNNGSGIDALCEVPNPITPASGVICRDLPSYVTFASGLAPRPAGGVYMLNGNRLCEVPDPTTLSGIVCIQSTAAVGNMSGVATRLAGGVWVMSSSFVSLCSIPDPSAPAAGVNCGNLPSFIRSTDNGGLTTRPAGGLYLVDSDNELCEVPDPSSPATNVTCRALSTVGGAGGITGAGSDGECMVRLARGATAVETLMIDAGRILLDTAFVDVPGVAGSATYNVQMMTANPYTLCTANRGNGLGTIPLPSLLVQVSYGQ